MIHASKYKPKVVPYLGDVDPANIDRAQSIDPTVTLNREPIKEIGRNDNVGFIRRKSTNTYRLTQYCSGSLEFWRKITNQGDSETDLTLDDFTVSAFDVLAYLTDDDTTFRGTLWYPKMRTSGFSLTIGDPDALIEQSFDFMGEDAIIFQGNNKYVINLKKTMESGDTGDVDIVIGSGDYSDYPDPVEDPDNAGVYMLRVLRVRSGETTELELTTDYTYTPGSTTLTIKNSQVGDVVKVVYTATTYISGEEPFVLNDSDPAGLLADTVSIFVTVGEYAYRLQSATIDVRFDREDVKEIGNSEVVERGIRSKTVTITLGQIEEEFDIEEKLRGVADDYGKIDPNKFADDISIIVKIYEDNTKSTFKMGFKATNLSPTELRGSTANVDSYVTKEISLEGETLLITSSEGSL